MNTTTLKKIDEITGGNIAPTHYYEWGNEPAGYVTAIWSDDERWYNSGYILKYEAIRAGLQYHCPYN